LKALPGDPQAVRILVKRPIKTGDIRKDLNPADLLWAPIGVSTVASSPDWQQSAKRVVDILITGIRPAHQSGRPADSAGVK
jgi:hypothetical protein